MKEFKIMVQATWDDEARVWFATSDDIAGLAVEADTMETLNDKVVAAVCDLIEINGVDSRSPSIPIHLMCDQLTRVDNPCH